MLASGYDLEFAREGKGLGQFPEFLATHKITGHKLAIEAKSKHRGSVLGFARGTSVAVPTSYGIDRLLTKAFGKRTGLPLLVFIELNTPRQGDLADPEVTCTELSTAWDAVQQRGWRGGFQGAGVVFYNDISPWYLEQPLPRPGSPIWAYAAWPAVPRHDFDAKPLLVRIAKGCLQRNNVPLEFET
jgi:hypothetical protein